jgi:hypothetical protein
MEDTKKLYEYRGVMDDNDLWDIEDELFTKFKLKEDSETFWKIYSTGYEEFYTYNREQLKNNHLDSYTNELLNQQLKIIRDNTYYGPWGSTTQQDEDHYTRAKLHIHTVIGFIYLKYQLDIPEPLKNDIVETIKKRIDDLKIEWIYNKPEIIIFEYFKNCIEKEDGEGLTNIGSKLPKRTIYE